jgi:hypothetical protein
MCKSATAPQEIFLSHIIPKYAEGNTALQPYQLFDLNLL